MLLKKYDHNGDGYLEFADFENFMKFTNGFFYTLPPMIFTDHINSSNIIIKRKGGISKYKMMKKIVFEYINTMISLDEKIE